jgi:hypothetical protein
MTVEQRLEQLEKRNKRLTVALTMTVVAMCAVVMVAATGDKYGDFDVVRANTVIAKNILVENSVTARHIWVTNDAGDQVVVNMGANDGGSGVVRTKSAKGKDLVVLNATKNGHGTVTTYQPNGKELVDLTSGENGGMIVVHNKTGEEIVQMGADEYGNGVVGAYNRKGDGPELKPGP